MREKFHDILHIVLNKNTLQPTGIKPSTHSEDWRLCTLGYQNVEEWKGSTPIILTF